MINLKLTYYKNYNRKKSIKYLMLNVFWSEIKENQKLKIFLSWDNKGRNKLYNDITHIFSQNKLGN